MGKRLVPTKAPSPTESVPRKYAKLTYRESRVLNGLIAGKSAAAALRDAGFPESLARHPNFVIEGDVQAEFDRIQAALVQHSLEKTLVDAAEIHEHLSDVFRARISEIKNDDHSFKPLSEWPEYWQRMAEGGKVEIEYASERSHDGATKDKEGGWDIKGKILKVDYKFLSKTKNTELLMNHVAVNAKVQPSSTTNVNINLHAEIKQRLRESLAREEDLKVIEGQIER